MLIMMILRCRIIENFTFIEYIIDYIYDIFSFFLKLKNVILIYLFSKNELHVLGSTKRCTRSLDLYVNIMYFNSLVPWLRLLF
jgi:hypothetical protein